MANDFSMDLSGWKARILGPAIHAKMQAGLDVGIPAAQAAAPVKSGNLRSLVNGYYDQSTYTAFLYGDAKYTAPQDRGFRTRSGRFVAGKHFLEIGLSAMGRVWGGNLAVQYPTAPATQPAKTIRFGPLKSRKAKVVYGHRPARARKK